MTSKSLEILERVKYAPDFMGGNSYYTSTIGSNIVYAQDIEIIKKDLEYKEELEKENKILKQENENLRDKLNSQDLNMWQLECQYGNYKKFIALLKKRCFKYHLSEATNEEYEFLREVLENENRSN